MDEATIRKGVAEGRFEWVDLTQADVDTYAEACERWSEHYANGTQKLYMLQVAAGFVVEVIGDATMVWLTRPGLAGKSEGKQAQSAQPAPSTKPGASLPPVKPSPTPTSKPSKIWVPPPEPPRAPSGARIGDF